MARISEAEFSRLKLSRANTVSEPTPRRGVMNGWESSFCREVLEPERLLGKLDGYRFEAITVTLYDGSTDVRKSRYTPDFMAWGEKDRRSFMRVFEVKGHRTRASIEKLKSAAQQYPMVDWCLVTGGPCNWEYEWL